MTTWRLSALVLAMVAVGSAFGARCTEGQNSDALSHEELTAGPTARGTAADDAPHLPRAFSVTELDDWGEAERALGYPIPKSVSFPLTQPYLFVQPALDGDATLPRKAVALYTVDGVGVRFTVAPAAIWN